MSFCDFFCWFFFLCHLDFLAPFFSKTKQKTVKKITERHLSCHNKFICKELARSYEKQNFTKKAIYAPFCRYVTLKCGIFIRTHVNMSMCSPEFSLHRLLTKHAPMDLVWYMWLFCEIYCSPQLSAVQKSSPPQNKTTVLSVCLSVAIKVETRALVETVITMLLFQVKSMATI